MTRRGDARGSTTWDGRGDSGARLPGGVYFLKLDTGEETLRKKVLLTR